MNSRERIIKAINHEEPDRIPIDWGMIHISGIHEVAYRNLLKYLGREEEIRVFDPVQRLAMPSEEILQLFNVDTRVIYGNSPSFWQYKEDENGNFYDQFGTYFEKCGYYYDFKKSPLRDAETIEDLKKFKMPDPTDKSRIAGLKEKAKWMYENTDKALVSGDLPNLYYLAWCLRGYENFMADTAGDPEFANYLLDMIMEWQIEYINSYLGEIGEYVQIMWAGDDWGSQDGPLIRPEEFRSTVVPRFAKMIRAMKAKSNAKVAYHSCGSVLWCMDDFIEMGVDIIQPLQANAAHMGDSANLKNLYGKKICFHGGLDNQGLFHLDKETLIEDTKYRIKSFAPGGGYIFGSGHNIQANCPPENIIALFETAEKYGKYPIK